MKCTKAKELTVGNHINTEQDPKLDNIVILTHVMQVSIKRLAFSTAKDAHLYRPFFLFNET